MNYNESRINDLISKKLSGQDSRFKIVEEDDKSSSTSTSDAKGTSDVDQVDDIKKQIDVLLGKLDSTGAVSTNDVEKLKATISAIKPSTDVDDKSAKKDDTKEDDKADDSEDDKSKDDAKKDDTKKEDPKDDKADDAKVDDTEDDSEEDPKDDKADDKEEDTSSQNVESDDADSSDDTTDQDDTEGDGADDTVDSDIEIVDDPDELETPAALNMDITGVTDPEGFKKDLDDLVTKYDGVSKVKESRKCKKDYTIGICRVLNRHIDNHDFFIKEKKITTREYMNGVSVSKLESVLRRSGLGVKVIYENDEYLMDTSLDYVNTDTTPEDELPQNVDFVDDQLNQIKPDEDNNTEDFEDVITIMRTLGKVYITNAKLNQVLGTLDIVPDDTKLATIIAMLRDIGITVGA